MANLTWPLMRKALRAPNIGYNTEVYNYFKDNAIDDLPNKQNKQKIRDFCLIGAKDSKLTADYKIRYFREQVQRTHLKPAIYGVPTHVVKEDKTVYPEVKLFFRQDYGSVVPNRSPVEAECSFRLLGSTWDTITESEIESLANKIKNQLSSGGKGITFPKGKHIVSYTDKKYGYYLQFYTINLEEGIEMIKKVLAIQNHPYDDDKPKIHTPKRNSENNPIGTVKVLGKPKAKHRWRPTATVRFCWATMDFQELDVPIRLIDTTGTWLDALVKV